MPPFVPRKRPSEKPESSPKRRAVSQNAPPVAETADIPSDSESSLSDAPSSDTPRIPHGPNDDVSDDDAVDWEDAMDTQTQTPATPFASAHEGPDLELTLNKNEAHVSDLLGGKKGPTKIERHIRIQTHCMHVQCLLLHNAIRNKWVNDDKVQDTLRRKLPTGLHKEYQKWRVASGLEVPEKQSEDKSKKKGKQSRGKDRDWGDGSSRLEPGQPDMSRGDPIIPLLKILAAYWKKQFKITAPGLRKHGYRSMSQVQAEVSSYQNDYDPERHGERFSGVHEFRSAAERMEGSRDVGAQLFTALLRSLGIETRMVASLQPLGFGWAKTETFAPKPQERKEPDTEGAELEAEDSLSDDDSPPSNNLKGYDLDLPFPIYWSEVLSPVTNEVIPVDPLVLSNAVATTPDLQAHFEPRGAKAEKAKQVICYVVAYSPDKTAKDVTTRYLRRRTWPGKTKGYRLPVEKIPIPGRRGKFYDYDWFRVTLRAYEREESQKTLADGIEDAKDLLPNQPDKKPAKEGDTLQSLRASTEFVLERFLRREEALRPGSKHVRTFTSGKGAKAKEENVYRRSDVLRCLSAESWHKEGRQIKVGEPPLKRVPIRAVTLIRKREVDELERATGEKPKQGLYAKYQTEYIIPPPIKDGIIPRNDYGRMDCFVPRMVPQGAAHVPWSGTVRVCKKLGIDYAEAVTGFEFGSKMAVPVVEGVVVAAENEDLLKDAWLAEDAEKRKKEQLKAEKAILQTWRKFLFGLRIAERVREEYGPVEGDGVRDTERDTNNPFSSRRPGDSARRETHEVMDENGDGDGDGAEDEDGDESPVDRGGGFLLPGEDDGDDDGGLVVEQHRPRERQRQSPSADEDDLPESDSRSLSSGDLSDAQEFGSSTGRQPPTRGRTRGAKGKRN